ncbi:MAG: hypothetical protein JRJ78_15765 [Deltaproteobacteria bacterium]|nr:hypothetical protein [Deltaproteobacteria bacterium]
MADIHIGKISQTKDGKGKVDLVYHIPLESPKAGVVPTAESSLAGLDQSEIEALADGTLVEVHKTIVVLNSQSQADIVSKIRSDWANVRDQYNRQYDFEHKFYGVTLNAAT